MLYLVLLSPLWGGVLWAVTGWGWGGRFLTSHISFSRMGTRGLDEDGMCGRVSVGQRDANRMVGLFLARRRHDSGSTKTKGLWEMSQLPSLESQPNKEDQKVKACGGSPGHREKEGQLQGGNMVVVVRDCTEGGRGRYGRGRGIQIYSWHFRTQLLIHQPSCQLPQGREDACSEDCVREPPMLSWLWLRL